MPFPDHAFPINGGCNCGSIRYRVKVPTFEERPFSVYCDEEAFSEKERIPKVLIDHCNDCRGATGCITPFWLICTTAFVEFSIENAFEDRKDNLKNGTALTDISVQKEAEERSWVEGKEILKKENLGTAKNAPLRWYNLSPKVFRGFCENCGTMICYRNSGLPE
jgi:hypothetical protein